MVVCVGECILALKSAFAAEPQSFKTVLTHVGEETGNIRSAYSTQLYIVFNHFQLNLDSPFTFFLSGVELIGRLG